MRMNAEGCVLGRLVSEGGEREQETAEWPPSEPDKNAAGCTAEWGWEEV